MESKVLSNNDFSLKKPEAAEKSGEALLLRTKEIIDKEINFTLISEIIGDIYKKCIPGVSSEILAKISDFVNHPKYQVQYSQLDGDDARADLGSMRMSFSAEAVVGDHGGINSTKLLKNVIHELLHLVTRSYRQDSLSIVYTGVRAHVLKGSQEYSFFERLNEGLTEIIADAVFAEYVAREGSVSAVHRTSDFIIGEMKLAIPFRYPSYVRERLGVFRLIEVLQSATSVNNSDFDHNYDSLCRALVREYFTNGYLLSDEMYEVFAESPGLLDILEKLRDDDSILGEHDLSEDSQIEYLSQLTFGESNFIKALFGRDVVGAYTAKAINSL